MNYLSKAKLYVQEQIHDGQLELIWSYILDQAMLFRHQ